MMDMAKDPREMRKQIDQAMRPFDETETFRHCASLIHAADATAYNLGWSGEDRMTAIAYLALQRAEELTERMIRLINTSPHPIILQTPSAP